MIVSMFRTIDSQVWVQRWHQTVHDCVRIAQTLSHAIKLKLHNDGLTTWIEVMPHRQCHDMPNLGIPQKWLFGGVDSEGPPKWGTPPPPKIPPPLQNDPPQNDSFRGPKMSKKCHFLGFRPPKIGVYTKQYINSVSVKFLKKIVS
jgi:hypothetical protein